MATAAAADDYRLQFVKSIGPGFDGYGWMGFVAFSPDGKRIVSDAPATPSDSSGGLTVWSFPGGRLLKRLPGRAWDVSPDWRYYAGARDIRNMQSGAVVAAQPGSGLNAFSRGGLVARAGFDGDKGPQIRVQQLATGKTVAAFGQRGPFAMALSPDGKTLASGYWDSVMLWDARSGRRTGALHGVGRYVLSLSFSPDGRLLAVGTDLGTLQIWDVRHRALKHAVSIPGGDVSPAAFSPDGRLAAMGVYGTGTVYLIDLHSGRIVAHRKVSDLGCGSAAFSPDGHYLITPSTGGLITWPYDRGGTIRVFRVLRRRAPSGI